MGEQQGSVEDRFQADILRACGIDPEGEMVILKFTLDLEVGKNPTVHIDGFFTGDLEENAEKAGRVVKQYTARLEEI